MTATITLLGVPDPEIIITSCVNGRANLYLSSSEIGDVIDEVLTHREIVALNAALTHYLLTIEHNQNTQVS